MLLVLGKGDAIRTPLLFLMCLLVNILKYTFG